MFRLFALASFLLVAATAHAQQPADEFLDNLRALCGEAYLGEVLFVSEGNTDFDEGDLVMHVRECTDDVVYVPFHVGDDRSRTWVITRTDEGLQLKHDHRHEDGTDEELTMYGGDTTEPGTATRQDFPADQETATMLPPAATNVWTVEVNPGDAFIYTLHRDGDLRARFSFDLTNPVEAPPAPWGWED